MYNVFMKFNNKNANDLLSKDFNLSNKAAQSVINFKDIKTFEELVQNEDFIFDFLKDKIVKKAERRGLYSAMDIGCIWLERELKETA